MTNDNEVCGTCTYWYQVPADPMNLAAPKVGLCRAVPPYPLVMGSQQTVQGRQFNVQFVPPQLGEQTPCCGMYQQRLQLAIKN